MIVDRAEGRELIDVDGRRYLDAISSLWVNTLGHRVPELDAALADQLGRVAHTTMLGNTNVAVTELAEALAPVVPVDDPHFLFAADGAVAVEQALKIAFQYWVNLGEVGHTRFLALGDAYHGDTVGSLSLGDGGVFSAVFDPLCFEVLRTPGYTDPGWAAKAVAAVEAHAAELAAVVVEPLVQGAAGMHCAEAADVAALGRASRHTACSSSATRWPRGSAAPARSSPPSSAGCGPTCSAWARGSPVGTSRCRPRWPVTGSSAPSSARTSVRAPSSTATPTAATPWPRRWPSATSASSRSGTCWATWPSGPAQLGALLDEKVAPHPAVRRSAGAA